MILTQSFAELGCPAWEIIGVFVFSDEPTDNQGYGWPIDTAKKMVLESADKALIEKHGEKAVLVCTQIVVAPGSAHPSYHRRRITITGDVYESR